MSIGIHNTIAKTKTMQSVINWAIKKRHYKNPSKGTFTYYEKLQENWSTLFMLATIGVGQTATILSSDDMPKERRIPLGINNIMTCVISFLGGLLTKKYTKNLTKRFVESAKIVIKNEDKPKIIIGIENALPVIVTTLLYKYIGQVIATPIADKVNKFLVKKGLVDYSKD